MTNSSKQELLEKALEKHVQKRRERSQRLTAKLECLNEFYKRNSIIKGGLFSDMQLGLLKLKMDIMAYKTPQAKLLKSIKQNRRRLLRNKENNKKKLTKSSQEQSDC
ncbi:hypothetical protein MUCCIDRAFT_112155 [Mucor lusitanicus CBS 277.49]|uniref:Uncharacterized protein n=1 Tax=Mucor lusitanicus CBS 277.49 TaxID=747725 RepID=A0A168J4P1_MUCCL|nr:hypothetical protein MUCCIDRAFT_112155 [Mucor lusitanicus CBS 277.49]